MKVFILTVLAFVLASCTVSDTSTPPPVTPKKWEILTPAPIDSPVPEEEIPADPVSDVVTPIR